MIERPTLKPAASHRLVATAAAAALALALAGCATQPPVAPSPPPKVRSDLQPEGLTPGLADAAARVQTGAGESPDRNKLFKGSGILIQGQSPGGGLGFAGAARSEPGGTVSLNFEGADIRDVIRNILGDILNQNYVIDPGVGGSVTIRTSSGIPKGALPSTLETLLRMNGATMVFDDEENLYRIVPAGAAVRGHVTPMLGNNQRNLPPGYSVQIVPLRFVSVREMLRLIEPFAKDASAVRADSN